MIQPSTAVVNARLAMYGPSIPSFFLSFALRANVLRSEGEGEGVHTGRQIARYLPHALALSRPRSLRQESPPIHAVAAAGRPGRPSPLARSPRRGMSQATSLLCPEARQGKPACLAPACLARQGECLRGQQATVADPLPSLPPSLRVNGEKRSRWRPAGRSSAVEQVDVYLLPSPPPPPLVLAYVKRACGRAKHPGRERETAFRRGLWPAGRQAAKPKATDGRPSLRLSGARSLGGGFKNGVFRLPPPPEPPRCTCTRQHRKARRGTYR